MMTTRDALIAATGTRYRSGSRVVRGRILDEFAAVTGPHRKHAVRLLRGVRDSSRNGPRPECRAYIDAMDGALVVLWEASDRICSKRLRVMLPVLAEAVERHGHMTLEPVMKAGMMAMSAATIDRRLEPFRDGVKHRRRAPPSAAVKAAVSIRTFSDWDDPAPSFFEADLVAHSGPSAHGRFIQTLTLTDVASGWTETAPVLFREQGLLTNVLSKRQRSLPMPLVSGACRCAFRNRSQRWRTWRGTAPRRRPRRADIVAGHATARLPRHDKGTIGTAMTMVATKAKSGGRDFAAPGFRSERGSSAFTVLRLTFFT